MSRRGPFFEKTPPHSSAHRVLCSVPSAECRQRGSTSTQKNHSTRSAPIGGIAHRRLRRKCEEVTDVSGNCFGLRRNRNISKSPGPHIPRTSAHLPRTRAARGSAAECATSVRAASVNTATESASHKQFKTQQYPAQCRS